MSLLRRVGVVGLLGLLAACGSHAVGSTTVGPTTTAATPSAAAATVNSRPDGPSVPCTALATPLPGGSTGSGGRLPALRLDCLGGGAPMRLADLRGPALLNLWASWCGPCAEEAQYLVAAHQALGDAVRFVGLDLSDDPADARAWNAYHQVGWPSLEDPNSTVRGPLHVPGPPVTFFVRSDGTVAGVHYGAFTSTDEVRAAVEKQLGPVAKGNG
jgi:thiol-disulfide isomerase/thioredoxin